MEGAIISEAFQSHQASATAFSELLFPHPPKGHPLIQALRAGRIFLQRPLQQDIKGADWEAHAGMDQFDSKQWPYALHLNAEQREDSCDECQRIGGGPCHKELRLRQATRDT